MSGGSNKGNSRRKKIYSRHASEATVNKALLGDFVPEDLHLYRVDRHTFTVYVGGEATIIDAAWAESEEPGVEHNMADRFELNLGILSGIDPTRPVLVSMASCGGFWEPGMQMFGAILSCPNPVTVLATRWARSMTSIIPLAADKFVIRPPAKYMYHHGSYEFNGLVQEAVTDFVELVKSREVMLNIYTARLKEQGKFSRWSEGRIRGMLMEQMEKKIDVWLEPDEAKNWGFVDEVFDGDFDALRAAKRNEKRRKAMFEALRRPVDVKIEVYSGGAAHA